MAGFENDVVYAKNADFTKADNQSPTEANGLATNGQLWIGTTSVNVGGTHVNVGTLTSPNSSITFGFSSPNITAIANSAMTVQTLTGNSGGAISPVSGNINLLTSNSTVTFAGTAGTLTQNFGLTNLLLGSPGSSITSAAGNVGYGQSALNALSSGTSNSMYGFNAGLLISSSQFNVGVGTQSLVKLTTGSGGNVALGQISLVNLLTGTQNISIGTNSGSALAGAESSNIYMSNVGVVSESNTIRIGTTGSSAGQQNRFFVAGVTAVTVAQSEPVGVNSTGQLSGLGLGTTGQVLTSTGASSSPTWQAPAASSKITTFTSGGSWTLDARSKSVEFLAWGGGGGGGSGRCGVTGAAGGGAGGGGGTLVYVKTLASMLTSSPYTVTIGAGGNGGASVNATTTDGNPGSPGGTTSVGSVVISTGGTAGPGGVTTTAAGASGLYYSFFGLASAITSGPGMNTIGGTPTALALGWTTGGGGGSGYASGSPRIGGAGGRITDVAGTTLVAGGLAGANTGATAGNGNTPGSNQLIVGGTGGGGGGNDGGAVTPIAGAGGNGAQPAGGGGGGSGVLSANASGAGGNGGNGQVIIIEYF